ncbi:LOW QUALITY PROTEIN: ribosomal L1 domain-containing protein 1-like [Macrotis lagotis]|uniref:LOW QUALITY PROTEIN: ribosomal L1 domain-containing protein 1-like n=1 Tax=Macrotis lagotis TaxID=92651 RepID=UPI003D68E4C8
MGAVAQQKAEPQLVPHQQIKKAIEALMKYRKDEQNANVLLLNENENVFLMVTLWKIPPNGKEIRIPLPHGIRPDTKEVCLFTKDESNLTSEQTENFYKQLLKKKGITSITEVIPYKRLKQEYKPYEAKRRLLGSYDLFLADQRIRRLLPSHIGKHFYRRKKVPLSVDLTTKNLSEHINRIIQGTSLSVTNHGCCNTSRVGHTGMPVDHLVENIVAAIDVISKKLPEKWESVKLLHLKTEKSLSLPIFSSFVSHLDSQKRKKLKQGKKVATKAAQTAVKSKSKCPLDGPELEAEKEDKAEPDFEDEIPQLVPIQATPQKCPKKAALKKESTGESLSAETPQAKTRLGKRKASKALETPEQINTGSMKLKKTLTSGKSKTYNQFLKKLEKESNSSVEVKPCIRLLRS